MRAHALHFSLQEGKGQIVPFLEEPPSTEWGEVVPWQRGWQEQKSLRGGWEPAAPLGGVKLKP